MARIRYQPIRIRRYFPPDDPLAVKVAALCIMIEDFSIEAIGSIEESIPSLDGLSQEWRRNYFLRNSFRTMHEIRREIDKVSADPTFKKYFRKQSNKEKAVFRKLHKALNIQETELKNVRNNLGGGHVSGQAVKKGLEKIDESETGLIQAGENFKNSHFKFCHKIVCSSLWTLMIGENSESPEDALRDYFKRTLLAFSAAVSLTGNIYKIYLVERKLIP